MTVSAIKPNEFLHLFASMASEVNRLIAVSIYRIDNEKLFRKMEGLLEDYQSEASKAKKTPSEDRIQQIGFLNWVKEQAQNKNFNLTDSQITLICLGVLFQRIYRIEYQQNGGKNSAAGGQTVTGKSESAFTSIWGYAKKTVSQYYATPAKDTVLYPILCNMFGIDCFDKLHFFVAYEASKAARDFVTQEMSGESILYQHSNYYAHAPKTPPEVLKGFNRIIEHVTAGATLNKKIFYLLMLFDRYSKTFNQAAKRYKSELKSLHDNLDKMFEQSPGYTIAEFLQQCDDSISPRVKTCIHLHFKSSTKKIETQQDHDRLKETLRLMIDNYYTYTSMGMLNYLLNCELVKEYPQLVEVCIKGLGIDKFPQFKHYLKYEPVALREQCQNQIRNKIIQTIIPQGIDQPEREELIKKYQAMPITALLQIPAEKLDINHFFSYQMIVNNLGFSRVHSHFISLLTMLESRVYYAKSFDIAMLVELENRDIPIEAVTEDDRIAPTIEAVTQDDRETIHTRLDNARSGRHKNMLIQYEASMHAIKSYHRELSHERIRGEHKKLVDKFTNEKDVVKSLRLLYDTHLLELGKLMPALIEEGLSDAEFNKRYRLFEKTAIESFVHFINKLTGEHAKLIQPFKSTIIALVTKHLEEQVKPHVELVKPDDTPRASSYSSGMFSATSSSASRACSSGGGVLDDTLIVCDYRSSKL